MPVGNDNMIQEKDTHSLTGFSNGSSQLFVLLTGGKVAWWVVMADSYDGAVGQYGFTHDDTDIDSRLCDATMRDSNHLD